MTITDIIGTIALIISTISFIPQAYKIFQTRSTKGISLLSFGAMLLGGFFWLLYGWMIKSYQILLTNAFISIVVLFIIIFVFYFKNENL